MSPRIRLDPNTSLIEAESRSKIAWHTACIISALFWTFVIVCVGCAFAVFYCSPLIRAFLFDDDHKLSQLATGSVFFYNCLYLLWVSLIGVFAFIALAFVIQHLFKPVEDSRLEVFYISLLFYFDFDFYVCNLIKF